MPRVTNFCRCGRAAATVWIISILVFYFLFQAVMENSKSIHTESLISSSERRSRLYDKMARDLDELGMKFLQGGETSQSLSINDIFELRGGSVMLKPKAADPPVRANVLYLSPEFSYPISQAVRDIFLPYFDGAIWFQNASLYHFSLFHASHHLTSVKATDTEIEAEACAVREVAQSLCPLKIFMDRVVLTSTGVLLGCWQVISGPDPVTIRAKLQNALPHSPEKQLYDPAMLHTSFARILGHPNVPLEMENSSDLLKFFHELVARVNNKIHGFQATVSELWFVEEYDVLALALDGRMKVRKFPFGCSTH
ncbi:uncharacterized protein LOC110021535 isoform X2 [Phalaenopsis equestris]|uniref:uncharacterized protein LOC110021535 isoform X2 n=1 Tax=Phalaenopsis equestris TaxID=78828 RepID=UPI0009E27005|nr:uncharacterized protein LOC110021535 isoform X2 [Phalaenopsis equestris]